MNQTNRPLIAATVGLLLLVLGGCGGGASSGTDAGLDGSGSAAGPDCLFNASSAGCQGSAGSPPYVIYSSRSDGATDAAVNTDIVATMSEPLDPASISGSSIRVVGADRLDLPGATAYDAQRRALVFRPSAELAGQTYTATVDAGVRDLEGSRMGRTYSWSFTVDVSRRDTVEQRSIQQVLDTAAYTHRIPGSIIAIRDAQGRTWKTTNGYADVAAKLPIRSDMRFRMGSNTKTFVSTLVLQLADARKLVLDEPVNTYLRPEMQSYLPAYDGDRITIRHLLNHTSGIANFTVDPGWGNSFISEPWKQYFPQELLLIANGLAARPTAPTFGEFAYSNTNYVLLGLIVRKTSGMSYEEAVANGLTIPLGLNETTAPLIGDTRLPLPHSRGYWEDTETGTLHDVTVRDASTVWSSGNLITSISDLARWGELVGKGTLVSSSLQSQRLQFVKMDDHLSYGLGVVQDSRANLLGHQGGMIGYTSQFYHLPDTGYTLAFFYNRTLDMHDYSDVMTYDVLKILFPNRSIAPGPLRAGTSAQGAMRKRGFMTEY
jgi:D-alanyl-D-alanine carboxypeptidase